MASLELEWRRQWQPTPVLLPGKSHGQRSLVGCSPWGLEESDTTEQLHFHFSHSRIGEGNGNPLQCSCLENPRDGRAWWAAVYGVTQSRTRLKWLSSRIRVALRKRPKEELGILIPWPQTELGLSALKVWSPSHWTTKEVPQIWNLDSVLFGSP